MAVSTQRITIGKAQALAKYYENKAKDLAKEMRKDPAYQGLSEEQLLEEARVNVERARAVDEGKNPDKVEYEMRKALEQQKVRGQTAYYGADAADDRHAWVVGERAGELMRAGELEAMFLGKDVDGVRLDDPSLRQLNALAKSAGWQSEWTPESMGRLRQGLNPDTGEQLSGAVAEQVEQLWQEPDRRKDSVTAFDMTFSAPKGVSLMMAYGSEETREAIMQAQDEATKKALQFAEENNVVTTRRGRNGEGETQTAKLLRANAKPEVTSREGDPQLHTHVLVSAYVEGTDGRRTAMDSQAWYGSSAAMDAVYLRALSEALDRHLGIELEERMVGDKTRLAGVYGVPEQLENQFSTRSQQINETLKERTQERDRLEALMGDHQHRFKRAYEQREEGLPLSEEGQRKAALWDQWLKAGMDPQAAALTSRSSKAEESEAEAIKRWQTSADVDGEKLLESAQKQTKKARKDAPEASEFKRETLWARMEAELVTKDAAFRASDVVAAAFRLAPKGASDDEVMAAAQEFMTSKAVQLDAAPAMEKVGDVWRQKARGWTTEQVVSQREEIKKEARGLARQRVEDPSNEEYKVDVNSAGRLASDRTLTAEQEDALGAVATGRRLVTINGLAGTGKTHVLGAAVRYWQEEDAEVSVMSVKAALAAELAAETGANRGMTLAAADMEKSGVFHTEQWAQGLSDEHIAQRHAIDDEIAKARRAGDEKALEKAEERLEEWHQSLPTKKDADRLSGQRNRLEKADKVAKYAKEAGLPTGKFRQDAYETREDLVQKQAQTPDKFTKVDHTKKQVIIVDEAGMASDDQLTALLEYAQKHKNIQLVMVGDYAQLSSVERGGGYRDIIEEVPAHDLTDIRRAKEDWERDAQREMHDLAWDNSDETRRQASEIVDRYAEHGRIHAVGSEEEIAEKIEAGELDASTARPELQMASRAAADWYMDHREKDSAVLVPTIKQQTEIASAVQERLVEEGELQADAKTASMTIGKYEQQVRIGEPVVIREGIPEKGLKNGWAGSVKRISPGGGITVELTDEHDRQITRHLTKKHLEEGKVSLAYSSTVHKAQGMTLDHSLMVLDPENTNIDRQLVYPGMTRGKYSNEVVVAGGLDAGKAALAERMSDSNDVRIRQAASAEGRKPEVAEVEAFLAEMRSEGITMSYVEAYDMVEENIARDASRDAVERVEAKQKSLVEQGQTARRIRAEREKVDQKREVLQHARQHVMAR